MNLRPAIVGLLVLLLALPQLACTKEDKIDEGVVISDKAAILTSTALVSTVVAPVKRGDKVDIFNKLNVNGIDYLKVVKQGVKAEQATPGWIEARHVVSRQLLGKSEELGKQIEGVPGQVEGQLKENSRLRTQPSRDSEVFTILKPGTKFEIVRRERREYRPPGGEADAVRQDEWFLVRLPEDAVFKAGWLYGPSIDIAAPDPLPQLVGPGRRIAACFELAETLDADGTPQKTFAVFDKTLYGKDEAIDFDRIYVVGYDWERKEYASMYIESGLRGVYPVSFKRDGARSEFSFPALGKTNTPSVVRYEAIARIEESKVQVTKLTKPTK